MSREMKDSGIPWIGEIPKDWEIKRLKQESVFINGYAFNSDDFKIDEGVKVIRIGDIGLNVDFDGCVKTIVDTNLLTPFRIKDGDILIAMSGATTGKCCIVDKAEEAYINQRVGIIRSDINKFIYYSLMTPYFMEFVNLHNAGSAQPNISSKAIGEFPILMMSLPEQQKIASFLDRKCSEIDEMIALQEQIIEELKAYKQSVITEAVTKGLNPDVPMKDSGIDWIGQIPEHYICSKLKYYVKIDSGDALSNEIIRPEGTYPVYGGGEIMGYHSESNTSKDSLVIGRVGARCGCVTMPNTNCWATDNALVLKTKVKLRFMYYLLIGINLNRLNTSNAQPLITATKVKNEHISLPPIEEQQAIAEYLDKKCDEIDNLISIKLSKIDSLKEYKKSIIYEYVTGKREVE